MQVHASYRTDWAAECQRFRVHALHGGGSRAGGGVGAVAGGLRYAGAGEAEGAGGAS